MQVTHTTKFGKYCHLVRMFAVRDAKATPPLRNSTDKYMLFYLAFNCKEILDVETTGDSWPAHLQRFLEGAEIE